MRKLAKGVFFLAVISVILYLLWVHIGRDQYLMYRYPIKFSETVERCADEYGVPAEIIYAVIHTESGFEVSAVSAVGAKGLMQLIDSTNKWIADVNGEDEMAERVFEPSVNIERGTWLLAYLYRQFGGWYEAAAAYNAGYGRVLSWLSNNEYSSDGRTLEYIPIDETRAYAKRVLETAQIYKELYFEN